MARVFLSYGRSDIEMASSIGELIRKLGHSVWRDEEGIAAGDPWQRAISRAITKSDVCLILLSPRSAQSREVQREVALADTRRLKLIPLLLEDTDLPDELSYALAGIQMLDARRPTDEFERLLSAVLPEVAPTNSTSSQTETPHSRNPRWDQRVGMRRIGLGHIAKRVARLAIAPYIGVRGAIGAVRINQARRRAFDVSTDDYLPIVGRRALCVAIVFVGILLGFGAMNIVQEMYPQIGWLFLVPGIALLLVAVWVAAKLWRHLP